MKSCIQCSAISRSDHDSANSLWRAFGSGEDQLTGQNYDHRRGWIVDQMKSLSSTFCYGYLCFCSDIESLPYRVEGGNTSVNTVALRVGCYIYLLTSDRGHLSFY